LTESKVDRLEKVVQSVSEKASKFVPLSIGRGSQHHRCIEIANCNRSRLEERKYFDTSCIEAGVRHK
jgi:hypothetical protein